MLTFSFFSYFLYLLFFISLAGERNMKRSSETWRHFFHKRNEWPGHCKKLKNALFHWIYYGNVGLETKFLLNPFLPLHVKKCPGIHCDKLLRILINLWYDFSIFFGVFFNASDFNADKMIFLRFEKLDITPKSAQKIKPVLEQWMKEAKGR